MTMADAIPRAPGDVQVCINQYIACIWSPSKQSVTHRLWLTELMAEASSRHQALLGIRRKATEYEESTIDYLNKLSLQLYSSIMSEQCL